MTKTEQILRAEHDGEGGEDDGYMEVVIPIPVSDEGGLHPIQVPEDVIDTVIDLYVRMWGIPPDRIYRAGEGAPDEWIWPEPRMFNPVANTIDPLGGSPEFLDRLALQKKLRAKREAPLAKAKQQYDSLDPSDPENMAAEQLIERIDELEESRKTLLGQRARLASTIDALEDCIHELYDENKELKATCARWEARAQVGLGAAAEASIDAEREQEKALLRRRMLEREIDDLDEYCELLERFASKKAKGKAQRKIEKRRDRRGKMIPNSEVFSGFPPLIPNDDADRAENEMHNLDSQVKMP